MQAVSRDHLKIGVFCEESVASLFAAVVDATAATGVAIVLFREGYEADVLYVSNSFGALALKALLAADAGAERTATSCWLLLADLEPLFLTRIDKPNGNSLCMALSFGDSVPARRERAAEVCRLVLPLFASALRICDAFDRQIRLGRASDLALHAINVGVLLLRRDGAIQFANRAAENLLSAGCGIQSIEGSLKAEYIADGALLHAALAHISAPDASPKITNAALLSFRRRDRTPLVSSLIGVSDRRIGNTGVDAVLYVLDPSAETASGLPAVCKLHGLSTVETTLVCHLVRGETIAQAAEKMRIKELTARSYLKQIFIKTGARRQTELVIQMLSSLIPLTQIADAEVLPAGLADSPVFSSRGRKSAD